MKRPGSLATGGLFLLQLLALVGCGSARPPAPSAEPEASAPGPDDRSCADARRMVQARRYELTASLDRGPLDSFARLLPEQRARLVALQAQPDLRLVLHESLSRLAVAFPASHPLGPAELLIVDELELVALHFADRHLRTSAPRAQLGDLLDCSTRTSLHSAHELELAPIPTEELRPGELPTSGVKQRAIGAQIRFRYYPAPEKAASWQLRLGLRLLVRDEIVPPGGALPGPGLLAALPLLGAGDGLALLAAITEQTGRPARFSAEIANESKPAGATPALSFQVIDQGWVRISEASFCLHRPGYRDLRAPRSRPGLQLVPPPTLAGLRAARAGGPLEVNNQSAYAALIYLDGALLGFVSAGERMAFRGIPEGYYRIYARSPTGIRAFGPFDHYVPGPLTLR